MSDLEKWERVYGEPVAKLAWRFMAKGRFVSETIWKVMLSKYATAGGVFTVLTHAQEGHA